MAHKGARPPVLKYFTCTMDRFVCLSFQISSQRISSSALTTCSSCVTLVSFCSHVIMKHQSLGRYLDCLMRITGLCSVATPTFYANVVGGFAFCPVSDLCIVCQRDNSRSSVSRSRLAVRRSVCLFTCSHCFYWEMSPNTHMHIFCPPKNHHV